MSRMGEYGIKERALAKHLGVSEETIDNVFGEVYESSDERGEYLVLTDEEANIAWEEELDRYLDECVLSNIEGPLAQYFDRDAWKRDARFDGRGHCLSGYDGDEHEVQIDDEWIYIFRVN